MMSLNHPHHSTATAATHAVVRESAKTRARGSIQAAHRQTVLAHARFQRFIRSNRGEAYVDMGVKILIGVVIGALLLSGLYTLFNTSVLPKLTDRINDMFDYTP